jgi:hypothetical protein
VRIAATIFGLGKKTENTENEKSTNPLIINHIRNPPSSQNIQQQKKMMMMMMMMMKERQNKTTKETEVVHSPSCFPKPTPTNAKQKAKLIEQKQTLNNQTLAKATTQPQEKNKEKKKLLLLVFLGWIQNTYLCCLLLSYCLESLATLIVLIFRNVENFKGIFFGNEKKLFLCEGKQGIFQNIPKSCMLVDMECSQYCIEIKNDELVMGTNGKCFALPFWKDGRWWWGGGYGSFGNLRFLSVAMAH